jgi:hypothetical protein
MNDFQTEKEKKGKTKGTEKKPALPSTYFRATRNSSSSSSVISSSGSSTMG